VPQASAPQPIFDDEFDGTALNASVWYTCLFWERPGPGCNDGGLESYSAHSVTLAGGSANLTATLQPAGSRHAYLSGLIQTNGSPTQAPSFSFLYGYAETRAKLPRGAGMWPAFWLLPKSGAWPPEIDILEWQGVDPTVDVVTLHWQDAQGNPAQSSSGVDTGVKLWQDYHTYGVDWEPDAITWYFDGRPIKRFTQRQWIPNKPMYVVFSLAIGGWEPGQNHPAASEFPATFAIDYVRVWKRKP